MSAITKRRTTNGHLTVFFVPKPPNQNAHAQTAEKPRVPLTPLSGALTMQPPRRPRPHWSRGNQRGYNAWRGRGRGRWAGKRPFRPKSVAFSARASSLRQTPLGEMNGLLQAGTHFDAAQLLDDDDRSNAPYPMWLDEFGSNDLLFANDKSDDSDCDECDHDDNILSYPSTLVTGNFIHPPAAVEGPLAPSNKQTSGECSWR